jgi:formate hydrogenlyase subunit 7
MTIVDRPLPDRLQYKPEKIELDESVKKAKAALLNDIKRSVYIYRCDLGGCNGCEIEIFATITPVFDAERFGIKNTPSPRHADILVYTGAVTRPMRVPALRAYHGAPDPKLVISYGACGCTGGIFHDNYCVWGGTDRILPVDVYIPGCPPTPAQTIYGFAMALGLLGQKLHHKDIVEDGSIKAQLRFADVPYKVRTTLEREARLYSGYRIGQDLSDEFMEALERDGSVFANINDLIAAQSDSRKAEVFRKLRGDLEDMVVTPEQQEAQLKKGLERVVPHGDQPDATTQAILRGAGVQ